MYNLPELDGQTLLFANALGTAIARETGINADIVTAPDQDVATLWDRRNCLFSQSCGYPLEHEFKDHIQAVAIPDYDAGEKEPGRYRSLFIVNKTNTHQTLADLKGGIATVNGWDSQSGFNTFRHSLLPLASNAPFFSKTVISGGHRNSIRLVAEKVCDIAAIDQVTFALIERCCPSELSDIRIIGKSAAAPALPFVTSIDSGADIKAGLLRALLSVFSNAGLAQTRSELILRGFLPAGTAAYEGIKDMDEAGQKFLFTKM